MFHNNPKKSNEIRQIPGLIELKEFDGDKILKEVEKQFEPQLKNLQEKLDKLKKELAAKSNSNDNDSNKPSASLGRK